MNTLFTTALLPPFTRRLAMAAALALAAAAVAPAALAVERFGFDTDRIPLIKPGMTQAEVQQALGRPARTQHYSLSQSTTWTYDVDPLSAEQVIFDVDFDAQGRVAASGERRLPTP